MRNFFWVILVLFFILACNSNAKLEKEIAAIPVKVDVQRFDQEFANASPSDLDALKKRFPIFFPARYPDSIWEFRMQDTLQQQLNEAVSKQFPSEEKLEEELMALFQHISYYFPQYKVPKVYTTTSDIDYRSKVSINDSLLVIALDNYLGASHPFYEGISKYISANMKPSQILPDVADAYGSVFVSIPKSRTLLDQMIYYGKIVYLKELWLPNTEAFELMGYSESDYAWAQENETDIWRYFIENELLYSTDAKLPARFIVPAPFSKFNLEIDNESPGRIGVYIGWKLVQAYMENNPETNVKQLMLLSADHVYKNSKYKPKK